MCNFSQGVAHLQQPVCNTMLIITMVIFLFSEKFEYKNLYIKIALQITTNEDHIHIILVNNFIILTINIILFNMAIYYVQYCCYFLDSTLCILRETDYTNSDDKVECQFYKQERFLEDLPTRPLHQYPWFGLCCGSTFHNAPGR